MCPNILWIKVIRVSSHGHVSEFKWEKYIFTWYVSELWHKLCHFIWHKHNSQKNPKYIIKVHWDWAYRITGTPLSLSLYSTIINIRGGPKMILSRQNLLASRLAKPSGKRIPNGSPRWFQACDRWWVHSLLLNFSKIYITVGTFLML